MPVFLSAFNRNPAHPLTFSSRNFNREHNQACRSVLRMSSALCARKSENSYEFVEHILWRFRVNA